MVETTELAIGQSIGPSIRRIDEFVHLPLGWDGDDADPITALAVSSAAVLVTSVADRCWHIRGVAPITSSPLPDGGLQLEWVGNEARIEVEVGPEGAYGYVLIRGKGPNATYEECDNVELNVLVGLINTVIKL